MDNFLQVYEISLNGQRKINGAQFPKVWAPSLPKNFYQLQQDFMRNHKQILFQLNKSGAILFRGFDIKSPNQFAAILTKLGIKSFQYIGGAAVRKLIIGKVGPNPERNVQVFTTNEAPPSQAIPFHNQLLQTPNYPQYVSFYCESEAETGGCTPIVNCTQLYQYIQSKHPQFLKKLEQTEIRYIRVVGMEDNPLSPIGRGWKNIFKVNSKAQAEAEMEKSGYQYKWLLNDDCQIISKKLRAVRNSKSGKKVFCNQMIAVFKGWVDQKNTPQKCLKFGNFQDIPFEIMNEISQYADSIKVAIPWKKGDFILIDNQMVAHSRETFVGNKRKVYACLFKGQRQFNPQTHLVLNSGDQMPIIGFGTWKISKNQCSQTVYKAIKAGYRLFDCACDYGNEQFVGQGLKKAFSDKIVKREDLFITSKLWNTFHRPQKVREGLLKSLKDLGLQYIDLYLIHFPIAIKYVPIETRYPPQWIYDPNSLNPCMQEDNVPLIQTWKAMQKLVNEGLIRNIGVSNFSVSLLRDLINSSEIRPAVLQIQIHPLFTQKKIIRFCRQKGIQLTSYSTFGASSYLEMQRSTKAQTISQNKIIKDIAAKIFKTPHQVVLRWAIQQGLAIIPKTVNEGRLHENRDLFKWSLNQEEMSLIDNLNQNRRFNDPGEFCEASFNTYFPIYQ